MIYVNRRNSLIRHDSEGVWVEDLGSRNGIWLNGQRLSAGQISPFRIGDRLEAPQTVLGLVEADPAWLTWESGTITRLAHSLADRKDFAGLPILADALEEAGCTSSEILEHCRQPGDHAAACWVLDMLASHSSQADAPPHGVSHYRTERQRRIVQTHRDGVGQ
jgi:hypothetical protein